jgi:hypothetical protein
MDASNLADLNKVGKLLVDEIKRQLYISNKHASGELINSIKYVVNKTGNDIHIQILGKDYLMYVDQGRKPGRMPPTKPIEKWIPQRGLKVKAKERKSVAFAIAKSIERDGIEPTHVIEKAYRVVMRDILSKVNKMFSDQLKQEIINELKNIR